MGSSLRTYGDACGVARALDLVGERWALMAVRELILGPKRFTDLRAGLTHVSADVLSQRLKELEAAGIVERVELPPPAAAKVYALTDWGRDLEDVVLALGRFGARAPGPPEGVGMSFDAHILTMRTLFAPLIAGDLTARVDLRLDGRRFTTTIADGVFTIERGEARTTPDAVITADPTALIDVLHGRAVLDDALDAGEVTVEGDEALVRRWVTLFPLPAPAAAA